MLIEKVPAWLSVCVYQSDNEIFWKADQNTESVYNQLHLQCGQ